MKLLRFFGGVYFAAFLIGTTALLVIAATFIESKYDSHQAAEEWIYKSPLFNLLLGGFFLNILLSSLSRYPYKKKHIPFLLTHLGLLMVIGGTFIKNVRGIQGTLKVVEGSKTNLLQLTGTQSIHVDGKSHPIPQGHWIDFTTDDGMQITLKGYLPHATFRYMLGLPEIDTYSIERIETLQEPVGKNRLLFSPDTVYHIGENGEVQSQKWDNLETVYSYGKGLFGYTVELHFPGLGLLESPLGFRIQECSDPKEKPALSIECKKDGKKDRICLHFNDTFAWPVFASHLLSFKEHQIQMPHTLHLRQARKVCYPGSAQTASYEADVWIDDQFFTLKMNQVYETATGYRFYLSSMSDNVFDSKQIVVVVNYDPVRNGLTYPGALLVVLGSVWLFFRKKV